MDTRRRSGALILWITLGLLGAAITWLGLVGAALLLSNPGRDAGLDTGADWKVAAALVAVGLAVLLTGIWGANRIYRRR